MVEPGGLYCRSEDCCKCAGFILGGFPFFLASAGLFLRRFGNHGIFSLVNVSIRSVAYSDNDSGTKRSSGLCCKVSSVVLVFFCRFQ